jgi:hypothetical protein
MRTRSRLKSPAFSDRLLIRRRRGATIADGLPVRIRIVKPTAGVLDGVSLGHLVPGMTYEVEESLGAYLVGIRCAEQLPDADADADSIENSDDSLIEHLTRGVMITNRSQHFERAVGHDRPSKRRRKRR